MTKARDLANAGTALTSVSATELGYLDGVTSAVQTQIDAKLATSTASSTYIPKTLTTTTGDIIYASGANTPARLGVGTTGQVLSVSGGVPAWATPVAGAFTLISSTTLSGTSVTLSAIPQTYKQLYLSIVNPVSSSGHTLNLVTQRTDGYGTTNTYYVGQYSNNGGAQVGFAARADIPLTPTGSMSSGAEVSTFEVTFYNYANYKSTYFATSGYSNTSSQRIIAMQSGMIDNNNVYNIVISGGTFTGGSVNLYGVN